MRFDGELQPKMDLLQPVCRDGVEANRMGGGDGEEEELVGVRVQGALQPCTRQHKIMWKR